MILAISAAWALPAEAAAPMTGSWDGRVDGGGSVEFKIKRQDGTLRLVKGEVLNVEATCTAIVTGETRETTVSSKIFGALKIRRGSFSYLGTGAATEKLDGEFTSKKRATGTFFYGYFHGGEDCTTGKVRWSAARS